MLICIESSFSKGFLIGILAHLFCCGIATNDSSALHPLYGVLYLDRVQQTVSIDATTVDIEEKGVRLRLTVVDTPGFGDAVDNRQW